MSEHVFNQQKWQSLTIFEQMGNIGSEVGRAFAARRRGDTAAMTSAWRRGLDLLDATAEQLARQSTAPIPSPMTNQDNMSCTTLSSACNLS